MKDSVFSDIVSTLNLIKQKSYPKSKINVSNYVYNLICSINNFNSSELRLNPLIFNKI